MPRKKKTPFIPMLTGVTMAFVLAAASFIGMMVWYNNPFKQVDQEPLPDFVGLKYETVAAQYGDRFEIVPEAQEFNNDYGKGMIYEQKPRAGTEVKVGSTVRVNVSMGQREVVLPNFAGKDAMQTFSKLRDLGIEYKEDRVYNSEVPLGCVIYTEPSKDSVVTSADVVTVYVSKGPEQQDTDVPSLVGLKVEDAKRLLDLYKLQLGDISEETSDQPTGTIIAQDPTPGPKPQGTSVNIVVSKEGVKRLTIKIPLPEVDRAITVRARLTEDNAILAEETINPMRDIDGSPIWSPVFTGDEKQTEVMVTVYIDGKRYIEYFINFAEETYRVGRDRSDAEEFR